MAFTEMNKANHSACDPVLSVHDLKENSQVYPLPKGDQG